MDLEWDEWIDRELDRLAPLYSESKNWTKFEIGAMNV